MNAVVEAALIAAGAALIATLRDIWIRMRVEQAEKQARTDRLEKERLDREQLADLSVVSHVGDWLSGTEMIAEHDLAEEKKRNQDLSKTIEAQRDQIASLLETIAGMTRRKPDATERHKKDNSYDPDH